MNFRSIIVTGQLNIRDALQLLDTTGKKVLFVVEEEKLVGAVSDGDVRRWILKNGSLHDSVETIMNREPIFVTEKNKNDARGIMKEENISAIPLINEKLEIENVFFWADWKEEKKGNLDAKVVIMAGGKGERLLPYTSVVPKPLIPIGEKPIIELIIDNFSKYGCNDFTLTINYKKNMIKAYFDDLERDYKISYIEEEKPLGTGGSLFFLKNKINEAFFVSNCDILLNIDYYDVYKKHKSEENIITIITSLKRYKLPYGVINIGEYGSVASLIEKPSLDYLVNTGVYIIEPEALQLLCNNAFMHITEMIEMCITQGKRVGTYPISEDAWMDMGQFEDMEEMKKRINR